ncbi:hypothetical protein GCM10007881_39620 [Mesorhizobium huakuii]|nr:hypothetical protein GCM10007881_39620 [Mesorhizobium huakuii]
MHVAQNAPQNATRPLGAGSGPLLQPNWLLCVAAMMDNKPFETPVVVELGHVGKYRHIRSTQEAAECLMTVWPLNRGPRHRDALDTCLKVLEGYRSTAEARRALIEAARESEVLVPDDKLSDDRLH